MNDSGRSAHAPAAPLNWSDIESGTYEDYELGFEFIERIPRESRLTADALELARLSREAVADVPSAPELHRLAGLSEVESFCELVLDASSTSVRVWPPEHPPAEAFMREVLKWVRPPAVIRRELFTQAVEHLRWLEDLIEYYEGCKCVREYRRGRQGSDHEARTLIDFYKRCLGERASITRYLAYRIDDDAIERASPTYDFANAFDSIRATRKSSGYRLQYPGAHGYLDHRQVNCWLHRTDGLDKDVAKAIGELFVLNRPRFYEILTQQIPPKQALDRMEECLAQFASFAERRRVVLSLRRMLECKEWLGFYALALPQVEGIFAEIGAIASPRQPPHRALPDKVLFLRELFDAETEFDYFQYIVPIERNRYSHTGLIADPYLRSLDVLYDLRFLCELLLRAKYPVVELSNLIRSSRFHENFGFPTALRFFELVDEVIGEKKEHEVEGLDTALREHRLTESDLTRLIAELAESSERIREEARRNTEREIGLAVDLGDPNPTVWKQRAAEVFDAVFEEEHCYPFGLPPLALYTVLRGFLKHAEQTPHECRMMEEGLRKHGAVRNNLRLLIDLQRRLRSERPA